MRAHKRGFLGVGGRDSPDGWAALRSTRSGPYVNRLWRATSSIFGGHKVKLLTSAQVIICGASIVILGMPVARTAAMLSRVPSTASAPYRRTRSLGRGGAGYAPHPVVGIP